MDNLPEGEAIGSYDSPDKRYTVATYRCSGFLTDDAVRAAVKDNKIPFFGQKNIYWEYHCFDAKVVWKSQSTVQINDKILNVTRGDAYDWRRNRK